MPKTTSKKSQYVPDRTKIVLKQDILIPAGTILDRCPTKREYVASFYETVIGYGRDHTAYFTIDIDAIEAFEDQFEVQA